MESEHTTSNISVEQIFNESVYWLGKDFTIKMSNHNYSEELVTLGGFHIRYQKNVKMIYNRYTPIPMLKLHALHKQYTDYPTLASEFEVWSSYKN